MTAAERLEPRTAHRARRRVRRRARCAEGAPRASESESAEPGEDALEEARDRARAQARFARELLEYGVVVGLLALFLKPVAWVVGILWGLSLGGDFARRIVEPALRRRWIDREVRRGLRRAVPVKRQQIEDQHARRVEELAAGVAHEIRNPLTAARSLVQQMGEDPASAQNVEYASVALQELARVERSISHLLRFAREQEPRLSTCALAEIVDSALETLRPRIEAGGVQVVRDVRVAEPLRADAEQLRRVILNLAGNALDALGQAGTPGPRIEVAGGENLAGTEVWLRVRDNGPGIDSANRDRIFRPFFTAKSGGTGLGLALVKKVVEGHGGAIELEDSASGGASFLVTLPRDAGPAGAR